MNDTIILFLFLINNMDYLNDFCRAFCPYGAMDIEGACKLADRMGYSPPDVVEWIADYAFGTDTEMWDIDCVSVVYGKLFSLAEEEIFSSGDDTMEKYIERFSNFLDSSIYIINGEEEAFKKIATEYIKNYSGAIPQIMEVFFDEIGIDIDEIQGISIEPAQTAQKEHILDHIERKSTDTVGV